MSANLIKCFMAPKTHFPPQSDREACLTWEANDRFNPSEIASVRASQGGLSLILGALAGLTLGGICWGRQVYNSLVDLGAASEEIFRGQQLPFLKFPRREG